MDPNKVKQIVYRFNADPSTDEIVEDLEGQITVPQKGGLIKRTVVIAVVKALSH